ncbi:hypothetical protein PGB90_004248 [Kerria lacca]
MTKYALLCNIDMVVDCKGRWNVLRNSYATFLRDIKNLPSGSAPSKKKKWYIADCMSVVKDYIGQNRKMASNVEVECDELEANLSDSALSPPAIKKKQKSTPADLVAGPMIEFLRSRTCKQESEVPPTSSAMKFFESLEPDVEKLTQRRQRKFKENIMLLLHRLLDEQDNEFSTSLSPSPLQQQNFSEQSFPAISYSQASFSNL